MAAELGIGVRVWIGVKRDASFPAGCTGTITAGPLPEGTRIRESAGRVHVTIEPGWEVNVDEDPTPGDWLCGESRLFPIDDGDPAAERERADRGEEVEA